MESTGSYWKPLYNVLESFDLNPIVVNAQHMRNVPGRKTDIKDAEWISDLLCHGLLIPSFIPNRSNANFASLSATGKSGKNPIRRIEPAPKMLEGGNIKLSGTVSNINGKSARNLLDLILEGEKFDEAVYDQMIKDRKISRRLKASKTKLIEDMNGVLSPVQIKMIRELRKHIDELEKHIRELDQDINDAMSDPEKEAAKRLTQIPGIGEDSAKIIISVIGVDMSRFPTDRHICSWAGISPGNKRIGKEKTERSNDKRKQTAKEYSGGLRAFCRNEKRKLFFLSIQPDRGASRKKRAIVAVGHSILKIAYHMLKNGESYKELGSNYYQTKTKESKIKSYLTKLENLGIEIPEEYRNQALQMS